MSDIIHISYRDYEEDDFDIRAMGFEDVDTNRTLLAEAFNSKPTNDTEKELLNEYINTLKNLIEKQAEFNSIKKFISAMPITKKSKNGSVSKNLEDSAKSIAVDICYLGQHLFALEMSNELQNILKHGSKQDKNKKCTPIEQPEQEEPTGTGKGINYILFLLSLNAFSLVLPLIILEAPIWVICMVTLFLFMPAILMSKLLFLVSLHLYNIVRPVLYVCGLIVAVQGKQDFFAIAFYILLGLQALSIIKNFIYTALNIFLLFTYKE